MTAELVRIDHAEIAELAPDPSQYVVAVMEQARNWLSHALAFDNVREVMEVRAKAEALSIYAREKQLAQEAQLASTEVLRRAERAIGRCVADGQAEGWVRTKQDSLIPGNRSGSSLGQLAEPKVSPSEFMGQKGKRYSAMHRMAGVDDEAFEEAISAARDEGNLSRANVIRKAEGKPAETPRKMHRRPLPDLVKEAGWDARNAVDKLSKYLTDERYTRQPRNRDLINPQLQSHLEAIAATCGRMLSDIRNRTQNDQDEGSAVFGGDGGAGQVG